MKKCLPFIVFALLVATATTASANFPENGNDSWFRSHRAKKSLFLATSDSSITSDIEFFNGFSIGASAGLGLFQGSLADYNMLAPLSDFSTYYKFAWRVYAIREIKWGLSAKLQFESGSLAGGRLTGAQSIPLTFESTYSSLSAVASFDVLNALFNKKGNSLEDYKFFLNAEIGIGVTFYRAINFWDAKDGRARGYVGYNVSDENPPTQRYTITTKDSPGVSLNIPVGFTAGYRINYKTDVTFSYTLNNLATDKLDAFDRDFSANDKYSYFGVGVRYNFNREKDQYPKKKVKEPKEPKDKSDKWSLFGSKKDDVSPNEVVLEEPLTSRKSNPVTAAQEDKELEEIRMKMFELQLKLFEMQYLLNGGKPAETKAK